MHLTAFYFAQITVKELTAILRFEVIEMSYDEKYMRLALELAGNAKGRPSPNPLVGAVIVKDNRVVGCGWHRKAGTPHAEIHALRQAGELARGADVYVTLEPCAHYGKTPPCANALVEAGVKRVYAAIKDPNPKVAGGGFRVLKEAGIEVSYGFLEDEARRLNEVFLKWIEYKQPFIALKVAMTLDGKIATASGESKWITNEKSREYGYKLRDIYDGIMVGINTVISDDPLLTARVEGGKNPVRIILDSKLRIPLNAKVLTDRSARTIIATTSNADKDRIKHLTKMGAEILLVDSYDTANHSVNIDKLLTMLAQRDICSILVEGGGEVNGNLVEHKLVDKIYFFIAPKLIGGKQARNPVLGKGILHLDDALLLEDMKCENLAGDLLITVRVII